MPAIASLIGGGLQAFGQLEEGKATREAQDYNAGIAEREATVIRQNSILNEYKQRKALSQSVGSMTASVAGSGIEMTGSPLDVIADSIANAELDISIDKYNSEVQARGKQSQADMSRYYGKEAERLSYTKAASTLLATGASYYDKTSKKIKIGE